MLFRFSCLIILILTFLPFYSSEDRVWSLQADGTGDAPTIQAAIDSLDFEGDLGQAGSIFNNIKHSFGEGSFENHNTNSSLGSRHIDGGGRHFRNPGDLVQ